MKEPTGLNSVAEFHKLFDLPVLTELTIPAQDRIKLRINLIQEELNELKEALDQKDKVEMVDALCDLQYVLSGAILEFGAGDVISDLFDEVHRSNMSKACKTYEEALATKAKYDALDQLSEIKEKQGQYLVYRKADGKVLKSVNYSPAALAEMIE